MVGGPNGYIFQDGWDLGDGSVLLMDKTQLNAILNFMSQFHRYKSDVRIAKDAIVEDGDLPGEAIVGGAAKANLFHLLEHFLREHSTNFKGEDQNRWIFGRILWGHSAEKDTCAQYDTYLSWKIKYNTDALFSEYKSFLDGGRKLREIAEKDKGPE
ncbi:uncharacterized protein BKCO1_27000120 [Diplodia corticola]|uniref:Uncharacterized protein n=1 Tax=Diplodia corticola TaxID=236234 RepID=A0A1J9R0S8_9PEZI|nr:uncharacterized protein BKCO1_27000120 [Diplodia corticola]OJD33850.1 hypothetical protein BKCO1_27000120 [Diplodia corticola]